MLRRLQETSSTTDGDEPKARVMRAFFYARPPDGVPPASWRGRIVSRGRGLTPPHERRRGSVGACRGLSGARRAVRACSLDAPADVRAPFTCLSPPFHVFSRLSLSCHPSFVSTDLYAGLSIGTAGPSQVGPLLEEECVVMIHTYCSSKGALQPSKMDFQGRSRGLDDTFQGCGNPSGRSFC